MEPHELYESLVDQCDALVALAREAGLRVRVLKLHGALYHDANRDPELAAAALDAAAPETTGPELLVPDDTAMVQLLDRLGVSWRRESLPFLPIGLGHRH